MSTISASTLITTALQYTADTTGTLVFQTGATPTTALTLNADQSATFAGTVNFATAGFTNLSYTGTFTGGTGVVNIGSGQFYKDASGNIGIGATTLYAPLDFGTGVGSAGAINKVNLYTGSGSAQYGFGISSNQLNYITGSSANHVWYVGGPSPSEVMRIDSSGRLGIGSTTVTSGYKLQVNGNIILGSSANPFLAGTTSIRLYGDNSATYGLTVLTSGNVGVGTTVPSTLLDVQGANADTFVRVGNNNASSGSYTVGYQGLTASYGVDASPGTGSISFVRVSNGNNDIVFSPSVATLPTEKMRLTTGGNVQIGGVFGIFPAGGSAAVTGPMLYNTSANGMGLVSSGTQAITFGQNNLEKMRIHTNGYVGIGNASPSYSLVVSNSAADPYILIDGSNGTRDCGLYLYSGSQVTALRTDSTSSLYISSGAAGGNMVFNTNSSERMRVTSAGLIGINTSSPVGQIDINRGTTGIRQPNSYGTAVNFAGGRSTGGSAATGTMLTVNFSAATYVCITLHIFSTAYALNGGGPASGMIGAYDIVNILRESAGSTYNITRVSGPALNYGGGTTWSLSGAIASNVFTLTGTVSSAGQSGFLFTGYMVYGGQGPSSTNIILTSYDMATTQVWGA